MLNNMSKTPRTDAEREKKERMQSWENLNEPKPDWETFKRMLSTFSDVNKLHKAWLKKTEQ
jgi:hypothetical protein